MDNICGGDGVAAQTQDIASGAVCGVCVILLKLLLEIIIVIITALCRDDDDTPTVGNPLWGLKGGYK